MTLSEYHPEASNGNGYHPLEELPEQLELPMNAEPDMTPARMAALTGLNLPEEDHAIETGADIADGGQADPAEDPLEARTERSLPNNPIAKMGLVGAGTFGAVAIAGLFLTATFEGGKRTQPAQTPAQPADPLVQQTFPDKTGSADGQVLTDLALSQQQQELAALNEKGKKLAAPTNTVAPRRVPARAQAVRPQPQRISSAAPRPQRLNYSTVRPSNYSPRSGPRITTTPIRPAPVAPAPAPRVAQAPQDPMSAWLAAAQIGSYGGNSVAAPAENRGIPDSTPVAMTSPVGQPVLAGHSQTSQPFLTPATYTSGSQPLGYQPVATSPLSSAYEEVALLTEQPLKSVNPGAKAKATLVTPLVLDQGLLQNAGSEQQILELKDPIKAADGSVVLPAGTQLVAQVNGFSNSGAVDLAVVAAMTPTESQAIQLPLPQGALQVYSSQGTPLMAKRMGGNSSGGILNELKQFALGAARQAAELYTRSDSTVISNGDNLVVSNRNQQPNLLAGIVQGGTDALFNGLELQQQAEAAALAQQANVLGLKHGTEVEILVTQPLMLPAVEGLPATAMVKDRPAAIAEEEQFLQSPFEFAQDSPFAPAANEPLMPEAVELMNIEGFKIPVEYTFNSGPSHSQGVN